MWRDVGEVRVRLEQQVLVSLDQRLVQLVEREAAGGEEVASVITPRGKVADQRCAGIWQIEPATRDRRCIRPAEVVGPRVAELEAPLGRDAEGRREAPLGDELARGEHDVGREEAIGESKA